MRCPICSKDVSPNSSTCIHCGASLTGPRSIDLDLPENQKEGYKSNNLQRITGININEINREDNNKYEKPRQKNNKGSKGKSKNVASIMMMIISSLLFISCIGLYFLNKDKCNCPKCKQTTENTIVQNKAYAGIYSFVTPEDYSYLQGEGDLLITNKKNNIILYNPVNINYSSINQEDLLKQYHDTGYVDAVLTNEKLGDKSICYISFSASDYQFTDFYYEYNQTAVVYGQASSSAGNPINDDFKNIIKSIVLIKNENAQVSKATFDYSKIFNK